MIIELQRQPTEEEIIERAGISPERYREVMRASKPVLSLHSRHPVTQEEFIDGVTDTDGGDNRRQPSFLRLALDDVVITNYKLVSSVLKLSTALHNFSRAQIALIAQKMRTILNFLKYYRFIKVIKYSYLKGKTNK